MKVLIGRGAQPRKKCRNVSCPITPCMSAPAASLRLGRSIWQSSKQLDLATLGLRFPEGLQVRVLRVENILDDHRKAGKPENHSGSQQGLPAGVLLNFGYPIRAAEEKKA